MRRLRAISPKGWIALTLYVVAFGLLSLGGWARKWWIVAIAIVLLIAAAVLLQLALRDASDRARRRVPWIIIGFGAAAVVAGVLGLFGAPVPGGVGLGGLCAVFLGAGHRLTEFRRDAGTNALRSGKRISAVCALAFVGGLVLCFTSSSRWLIFTAGGLLFAPAGLTLLSEGVLRRESKWLPIAFWPALALLLAGGWAVGYALDMDPGSAVIFAVAVGVLILAIASSTQADVLLVVTFIGIFWASQPSGTATDDLPEPTDGQRALVALGDSYMSGEGASEFLEKTNDAGGNQCRRAPQAYPRRLFTDGKAGNLEALVFLACSGDETKDLQRKLPRLERKIDKRLNPQLVVVSIGGNDAGFAKIATACLAPGSCAERGQIWLDQLQSVARKINDTYVKIRKTVGMDVPVLAVPYPVPVRARPCPYSSLTVDENRFLQRFVKQLDGAVHHAADAAGVAYLGRMRGVFYRTHLRVCDRADEEDVGVNFVRFNSVGGAVDQLIDPRIWLHNSFHPNETGHEQMTAVLARWIAHHHPARHKRPDPTEFTPFTPPSLAAVMGPEVGHYCRDGSHEQPRYCGYGDYSWALAKVAGGFAALTPALLFLVGGWWVLALLYLRWWRGELLPAIREWWRRRRGGPTAPVTTG
jgi:lysophospholipase L1-like esterase